MLSAKKLLQQNTAHDQEEQDELSEKPRRTRRRRLRFMWRSLILRARWILEVVRLQQVLEGCDQLRKRVANAPVMTTNKKKKAKDQKRSKPSTVVGCVRGLPLPRSSVGTTFPLEPELCAHDAQHLRARAGGGQKWVTCTRCGSRWERLEQMGVQRQPALEVTLQSDSGQTWRTPPQCPGCPQWMRMRQNRQNQSVFYGCQRWPACTTTLPCHQEAPHNLTFENNTEMHLSPEETDRYLGIQRESDGTPKTAAPTVTKAKAKAKPSSSSADSSLGVQIHDLDSDMESASSSNSSDQWDLVTPTRKSVSKPNVIIERLQERMSSGMTKDQAVNELLAEMTNENDVKEVLMMLTQ